MDRHADNPACVNTFIWWFKCKYSMFVQALNSVGNVPDIPVCDTSKCRMDVPHAAKDAGIVPDINHLSVSDNTTTLISLLGVAAWPRIQRVRKGGGLGHHALVASVALWCRAPRRPAPLGSVSAHSKVLRVLIGVVVSLHSLGRGLA